MPAVLPLLKLPFMDDGPDIIGATSRTALPLDGRRVACLEQRLTYLADEQARLKGDAPFRRFLRGAMATYRRFVLGDDPAHRFHCWVMSRTVSAGLDQLERSEAGHQVAGPAPDGLDPGRLSIFCARNGCALPERKSGGGKRRLSPIYTFSVSVA
jgi:hypothetical protein